MIAFNLANLVHRRTGGATCFIDSPEGSCSCSENQITRCFMRTTFDYERFGVLCYYKTPLYGLEDAAYLMGFKKGSKLYKDWVRTLIDIRRSKK